MRIKGPHADWKHTQNIPHPKTVINLKANGKPLLPENEPYDTGGMSKEEFIRTNGYQKLIDKQERDFHRQQWRDFLHTTWSWIWFGIRIAAVGLSIYYFWYSLPHFGEPWLYTR